MGFNWLFIVVIACALCACAHVETSREVGLHEHASRASYPPVRTVEDQRAQSYMTQLIIKKNRFLLASGYGADGAQDSGAPTTASCALIAYSQWAASVDQVTFDVFARTMERCYAGTERP